MEIVYKLRHKATGLFFKDPDWATGNVSKTGKVFITKPSRKSSISMLKPLAEEVGLVAREYGITEYKTELSDWEIVEFKLIEI